jgi:hypothetical protein
MRAGLLFFVGAWAGWVAAAAISVYGFGHLVHPYKASASFGILATASILPSCVVGLGAFLGARGASLLPRVLVLPAMGLGLACALVFFAAEALGSAPPAVGILVTWVVLPALAAFWTHRLTRTAPPPNTSRMEDLP